MIPTKTVFYNDHAIKHVTKKSGVKKEEKKLI